LDNAYKNVWNGSDGFCMGANTMNELWRLSVSEVAHLVKTRKVSAREVADATLQRLASVNPRINAIVECRPDLVRKQADRVDCLLARGNHPGPLAGIQVTVKINIDQASFATTDLSRLQENLIAEFNSPVIDNLIRAGAVLLGRSNAPTFALPLPRLSPHGIVLPAALRLLMRTGRIHGAAKTNCKSFGFRPDQISEAGELPAYIVAGTKDPKRMRIVDRILLSEVITKLPEGYRQAIILHDIQRLEHREIAARIGRSIGTSKSQLHRARVMLRELIAGPSQKVNSQSLASIV
jgi:RNA polymerase sigma factor (sigma-70 family)